MVLRNPNGPLPVLPFKVTYLDYLALPQLPGVGGEEGGACQENRPALLRLRRTQSPHPSQDLGPARERGTEDLIFLCEKHHDRLLELRKKYRLPDRQTYFFLLATR